MRRSCLFQDKGMSFCFFSRQNICNLFFDGETMSFHGVFVFFHVFLPFSSQEGDQKSACRENRRALNENLGQVCHSSGCNQPVPPLAKPLFVPFDPPLNHIDPLKLETTDGLPKKSDLFGIGFQEISFQPGMPNLRRQ